MPNLKDNEYYWKDLEGLSVFTTEKKYLGVVDFIFNNGSNDVLVIKKDNNVYYVAFIKENISQIDNDTIIVRDESV